MDDLKKLQFLTGELIVVESQTIEDVLVKANKQLKAELEKMMSQLAPYELSFNVIISPNLTASLKLDVIK